MGFRQKKQESMCSRFELVHGKKGEDKKVSSERGRRKDTDGEKRGEQRGMEQGMERGFQRGEKHGLKRGIEQERINTEHEHMRAEARARELERQLKCGRI